MEYVAAVAPLIEDPLNSHWYESEGTPVALTLKEIVVPARAATVDPVVEPVLVVAVTDVMDGAAVTVTMAWLLVAVFVDDEYVLEAVTV